MKTLLKNSLRTRIPQAVLLLGLIATVAAFSRPNNGAGSFKLDGTWAGRSPGELGDVTWMLTYSPDSSGRYATFTEEWITNGAFDLAALLPVGATKTSLASGYARMTGKDTGVTESTWYLAGPSDEPTYHLDEIKAIAVMTGEFRFIDPYTIEGTYDLKIYATGDDPSMIPTEAMGDPYIDHPGIVAINQRVF